MIKHSLLFFILFISINLSFAQSWQWASSGKWHSTYRYTSERFAARDLQGNIYMVGDFGDTIAFGNDTLKSTSPQTNGFITKCDSTGKFLWAKSMFITPNGSAEISYVTTDIYGNVIISGYITDSIKFGTKWLMDTVQIGTAFIAKYNSVGKLIWAKQFNVTDYPNSFIAGGPIITDKSGCIYMTGGFSGKVYFGKDTVICSYGDLYLCKFDTSGDMIWIRQATGQGISASGGNAISMDAQSNLYITGTFYSGVTNFGSYSINSGNSNDLAFIVKYDSSGNVIWLKQTAGWKNSSADASTIITDPTGNSYITGDFVDSISFGSHYLYFPMYHEAYLAKYDSKGNPLWAIRSADSAIGSWTGFSLALDNYNHLYFSAGGSYDVKFGGMAIQAPDSNYSYSILFELDTAGKALCGSAAPKTVAGNSSLLINPTNQNVYYVGTLDATAIYGKDTIQSDSSATSFIAEWKPCTLTAINTIENKSIEIKVYPNPSSGRFTINLPNTNINATIVVYNMLGEEVYSDSFNSSITQIDLSNNPTGLYLYRIISKDGNQIADGKLVIQ